MDISSSQFYQKYYYIRCIKWCKCWVYASCNLSTSCISSFTVIAGSTISPSSVAKLFWWVYMRPEWRHQSINSVKICTFSLLDLQVSDFGSHWYQQLLFKLKQNRSRPEYYLEYFSSWNCNVPREPDQQRNCWRPVSLRHQVGSSIGYIKIYRQGILWGLTSTSYAISVSVCKFQKNMTYFSVFKNEFSTTEVILL